MDYSKPHDAEGGPKRVLLLTQIPWMNTFFEKEEEMPDPWMKMLSLKGMHVTDRS